MKIIPALYLSRGHCVSPYKGQNEQTAFLGIDPLRAARVFESEGAKMIHITDGDGGQIPSGGGGIPSGGMQNSVNRDIALNIAKNTDLSVVYGEGFFSPGIISNLFEEGISAICIYQFSRALLEPALEKFGPSKIFFTIRSRRNMVEGDKEADVADYAKEISQEGIKTIIFRDTMVEGTFHPNFDEAERLVAATDAAIFAFGGIGAINDLDLLSKEGVKGAIISRAFFEKRLSVRECVKRFGA